QRLLDGAAPWAEVYGMRPPGVYAAYALAIAAFGPSAEAIRLGLLCATAATAALLFGLGAREASRALHGANPFPDAVGVASGRGARRGPGARIAVPGSTRDLLLRAAPRGDALRLRLRARAGAPEAEHLQEALIARLEAAPPRFLAFVSVGISWQP